MTLHATLTPDATLDTGGWSVAGAGSHHAALADASDASYISAPSTMVGWFALSNPSAIPSGAIIKSVRLGFRASSSAGHNVYVYLSTGGVPWITALGPPSTSPTAASFDLTYHPAGGPWTAADVDSLVVAVVSGPSGETRVHQITAEIHINSVPTVALLLTDPLVETDVTDGTQPLANWLFTDADGDPQKTIHFKFFSGTGTVADPETEVARLLSNFAPDAYSASVIGLGSHWPNAGYTKAIKVKDTGTDTWSAWSQRPVTFDLPAPNPPSLDVFPEQSANRYRILVDQGGGFAPEWFDIDRSDDGGLTWTAVHDGYGVPWLGLTTLIYDYRAPRMARSFTAPMGLAIGYNDPINYNADVGYNADVATPAVGPANVVRYRARASRSYTGGAVLVSNWTVVAPESLVGDGTMWLKHPTDPSKSITVQHLANWESTSEEDMAVLRASGRADWVVFGGVASLEKGEIEMIFAGDAAWAAFEALRSPPPPVVAPGIAAVRPAATSLLFQTCFGDTALEQMWVRLGANRAVVRVTHSGQHELQRRRVKVGFVATKAPA